MCNVMNWDLFAGTTSSSRTVINTQNVCVVITVQREAGPWLIAGNILADARPLHPLISSKSPTNVLIIIGSNMNPRSVPCRLDAPSNM